MQTDWIAVEYDGQTLRAAAMQGPTLRTETSAAHPPRELTPERFETALLALVDTWLTAPGPTRVLASGLPFAPLRPLPCAPLAPPFPKAPATDPRLAVTLVPGLSQAAPPDLMQGPQTAIAGFAALNDGWDGVLCLPGPSRTVWAHLSAGEVVSFLSFLTPELFAVLADTSSLHQAVAAESLDAAAFAQAAGDALSRPETLAARLARLPAAARLTGTAPEAGRAALAGLLIGAELAAARAYWLGQQIAVIGGGPLAPLYIAALEAQGAPAGQARGDVMLRAGLHAALKTAEPAP